MKGDRFLSLVFDDCPTSAFSACRKILDPVGVKSTFYVSGGFAGRLFNVADIAMAYERGHEIACHTFSHKRSSQLRLVELLDDIDRNREFLYSIVPGAKIESFAFPYGETSEDQVDALLNYFRTIRTGACGSNSKGARVLSCERLYSCLGGESRIAGMFGATESSWLILYTHDVQLSPSRFGCTEKLLKYACEMALENGWIVDSVSGVRNR